MADTSHTGPVQRPRAFLRVCYPEGEQIIAGTQMPKVEIRAELLQKIAQEIWRAAEGLPIGSVERQMVERVLLNDAAMVEAFLRMHLENAVASDG